MAVRPGSPNHRTVLAFLLVGSVGYSFFAAATTPFSTPANVATALPIIGVTALAVAFWPRRADHLLGPPTESGRRSWPWLAWGAVAAGWELWSELVKGSRADHPTFSSMTNAVDRTYLLKVVVFLAWLALGWSIVRAGSRRRTEEE